MKGSVKKNLVARSKRHRQLFVPVIINKTLSPRSLDHPCAVVEAIRVPSAGWEGDYVPGDALGKNSVSGVTEIAGTMGLSRDYLVRQQTRMMNKSTLLCFVFSVSKTASMAPKGGILSKKTNFGGRHFATCKEPVFSTSRLKRRHSRLAFVLRNIYGCFYRSVDKMPQQQECGLMSRINCDEIIFFGGDQ